MHDVLAKMAELKFEAPLAKFEETEDWGSCDFLSNPNILNDNNINLGVKQNSKLRLLEEAVRDANVSKDGSGSNCMPITINGFGGGGGGAAAATTADAGGDVVTNNVGLVSPNCNSILAADLCLDVGLAPGDGDLKNTESGIGGESKRSNAPADTLDTFAETFGGSLEDLVNTFDERIIKCFGNYQENIEELAPVQVRSQEEIMNECQMWWTITGNFGNILPIDWSKSFTRQMHMPTLNLGNNINNNNNNKSNNNHNNRNINNNNNNNNSKQTTTTGQQQQNSHNTQQQNSLDEINDLTSEDEAVANDLDMHALILNGLHNDNIEEPTAEDVIKEIEAMMEEANEEQNDEPKTCESEIIEKAKEVLGAPLYTEKLQYLSLTQLNELYMEMEVLIQELSETLINELALRDELEYEKELKNSFISLLLSVQNKRRQYHVEKKRGPEPKYLTTVIPYHMENGTPNNQTLQVLIKILKAINEDSPTVPTLLTDYILKVLCPT